MDLYGWDTGYATTIDVVNSALADPKGVLSSFSLTVQDMTIEGQFGSWSIIDSGAGHYLHLQTDLASGTISGGGIAETDLAGISVQFEINLLFLPGSLPNQKKLAFNFKSVGEKGTSSAPGVVTPLQVLDPDSMLNFTQTAVLGAGIALCLVDKAASISFAFAEINLVPPDTANSWLTPVECSYTYYQTGANAGYLIIFSTISQRDISKLSRAVDPKLISGGGNGFFAISELLFLNHVIRPIMPAVYSGTDATYYTFDSAARTIKNIKTIKLPGTKSGAITYYPEITSLAITVSGSSVVSVVSGSCDMHIGMSMTFSVTSSSAASFNVKTSQLTLSRDPNPRATHKAHIPWYDYLMGPVPDIIMAIVVPIVADGIANGLNAAVKNLSFARAGPQGVQWPGMKEFLITGGELDGGFRLSGKVG